MPVASDIQTIVSDLSVAIAERRTYGRVELDRLRRQLETAARELGSDKSNAALQRQVIEDLVVGIETHTINLAGVATRARRIVGIAAPLDTASAETAALQ